VPSPEEIEHAIILDNDIFALRSDVNKYSGL